MTRYDTVAAPLRAATVLSPDRATLTITLHGELDVAAAGVLRCLVDGVAASGVTLVRFDLVDVAFCDARGWRLLERSAADIAAGGVGVTVTRPSAAVTRVVRIGERRRTPAIMPS